VKPVLIAGIGNIFHGDDGFGVAVAERLTRAPLPAPLHGLVEVVDIGIRGLDLAYALTGGYRLAVLVDTVQRGEAPGTLYVIEPEAAAMPAEGEAPISPHGVDPASVLRLACVIGGRCAQVLLVGCEPASFGAEDEGRMGLSDEIAAAVGEAAALALSLATDWLNDNAPATAGATLEEIVP